MPENKELPEEEVALDVEEGDVEAGGGGLLSLLKMLLPIVLISLGGGGYLAYSQYNSLAQTAVSMGIDFGFANTVEKDAPHVYGEFLTIDDLLINPAGSGGKRFLVVSLGVETQKSAVLEELGAKDIVIRDAILRLLSQRTAEELGSIELRAEIKDEVRTEMNRILQKGQIDRLYFTQYLLQ